jgi:uncharacterized membrane protein (DUF485 family)
VRGPTESAASPSARTSDAHQPDSATDRVAARYVEVDQSSEFQALRSSYRRFVFPVTLGALVFYFTYVLLAAYAPGFMSETVTGNINVGLVFGLLQFVMVFGVTTLYVRYARNVLDPQADAIRAANADLERQS